MSAALFWRVTRWARAARFWLLLFVALLAWLGIGVGEAHAACVDNGSGYSWSCTYRDEAHAKVSSLVPPSAQAVNCHIYGGVAPPPHNVSHNASVRRYEVSAKCVNPNFSGNNFGNASYGFTCPAGKVWNASTNQCDCPDGSVAQPDGSCKSCGDLNGEPGSPSMQGEVVRGFRSRCVGGCTLAMTSGWCTSVGGIGGGQMCSGQYLYTGASCSASPPAPEGPEDPADPEPPEEPPQECKQAGDGQTFCIKPNGDHCHSSARTGRQFCWKPGQTGEQGAGSALQTRGAGSDAKPPSSGTTHGGDTLTPVGNPVTTTTTSTSSNGSAGTTVIITTTQNHQTENGTDSKPGGDEDEPGDGSGRPGSGSGDDEGGDGSASGGGNCDTPPVASDPQLEMIANQAWATRCAVEAGNAANVSGDVGDCKAPFSVEGDNANAHQLRALRASICGPEARADAAREEAEGISTGLDGLNDTMEGEFTSAFGSGDGIGSLSLTRFGGGGGCPVISVTLPTGQTWAPPPEFCNVIALLRLLFLAIATIWALRIVGSE